MDLELRCIEHGTLISDTGKRRTYWLDASETVGACSGDFTTIVFAEWVESGAIHGRPISKAALKRLGVNI